MTGAPRGWRLTACVCVRAQEGQRKVIAKAHANMRVADAERRAQAHSGKSARRHVLWRAMGSTCRPRRAQARVHAAADCQPHQRHCRPAALQPAAAAQPGAAAQDPARLQARLRRAQLRRLRARVPEQGRARGRLQVQVHGGLGRRQLREYVQRCAQLRTLTRLPSRALQRTSAPTATRGAARRAPTAARRPDSRRAWPRCAAPRETDSARRAQKYPVCALRSEGKPGEPKLCSVVAELTKGASACLITTRWRWPSLTNAPAAVRRCPSSWKEFSAEGADGEFCCRGACPDGQYVAAAAPRAFRRVCAQGAHQLQGDLRHQPGQQAQL